MNAKNIACSNCYGAGYGVDGAACPCGCRAQADAGPSPGDYPRDRAIKAMPLPQFPIVRDTPKPTIAEFQEVDFTVVSEYQMGAATADIVVQLREAKPDAAYAPHSWKYHSRYISFWAPAPAVNFPEISLMFLYSDDAGDAPTRDWQKLREDGSTPFDSLGWVERVHNRIAGMRKDGSVIDYTRGVALN